jgi:thiol-disulfide isomerase/thioredoxin
MNKKFIAQVVLVLIITAGIGGLVVNYDAYEDIQNTIVNTLCLSCIKLDPVSIIDFTFDTANGEEHSEFVLEDLTKGPIFIEYRSDVCKACDDMAPIVKDIFEVSFEKEDTLYKLIDYNGTDVHFYHINLDHATQEQMDSFDKYDKDVRKGVPMFVVITVKYERGMINPCYTSVYGTLGIETELGRRNLLTNMIDDGIKLYEQNHEGYKDP